MESLERLRAIVRGLDGALVAFSGGVDSALVLAVAREQLGDGAVALTAVSPTLPREEYDDASRVASRLGARHLLVDSHEMEVEGFRTNPTDRCYYCKTELYTLCRAHADRLGIPHVLDGVNVDDLGDHRPGLRAAEDRAIRHPLVEAGLRKADVRAAARALGLDVWDKPAFACLSSRIPYGTEITLPRLRMVGEVESELRRLGFRTFRVRHHGNVARIELAPDEMPRLLADPARDRVLERCREVGFAYVAMDLQGYRPGSLNEPLKVLPREP